MGKKWTASSVLEKKNCPNIPFSNQQWRSMSRLLICTTERYAAHREHFDFDKLITRTIEVIKSTLRKQAHKLLSFRKFPRNDIVEYKYHRLSVSLLVSRIQSLSHWRLLLLKPRSNQNGSRPNCFYFALCFIVSLNRNEHFLIRIILLRFNKC